MIRTRFSTLVALGILLAGVTTAQVSASPAPAVARYVVTFKDGTDARLLGDAMSNFGKNVVHVYQSLFPGVAVDLTAEEARSLAADPTVALVEPDSGVSGSATQGGAMWALDRIDQQSDTPSGSFSYPVSSGLGVVVYLVDSGLMTGMNLTSLVHNELVGRVAPGSNWVQDSYGTDDCAGHGTKVAGTIAGSTNGVAKLATLVPVRVLDCGAHGNVSDVIAGLDWIASNRDRGKPAVVNLSLSGSASQSLDNAVSRLFDSGVTVIAAAGNDGGGACNYSPGRAPAVLTVGAMHTTGHRATFSNYGTCLDLFAPGSMIQTASIEGPSQITTFAGTSSAAAIVAGVAALILGENPGLSAVQVRDQIMASATPGVVLNAGEGSPTLLVHVPNNGS